MDSVPTDTGKKSAATPTHTKNAQNVADAEKMLKIHGEDGVRENHTGILNIEGNCRRRPFCRGVLDFFAVRSVAKSPLAFQCFWTRRY